MKYFLGFLTLVLLVSACDSGEQQESNDAEWTYLFDGSSIDQWRSYNGDTFPSNWALEDSLLVVNAGGGDLITKEKFTNFELELDFQLTDSANSGIFYRVVEVDTMAIWHNAPEYQLLDDAHYTKELGEEWMPTHRTAENYDMHATEDKDFNPIGEWNTAKVVVNEGKVEHWLNGKKTIEYDFNSEEWKKLYEASKFNRYPNYGKAENGHIGLQDHGHTVRFRNVRIRTL